MMSKNTSEKSWVNPKIEVRESNLGGKGMFAVKTINKDEKVLVWGGEYVTGGEALVAKQQGKLVMQWDKELFSIEDKGDDETYYINHSCNPNVWMEDVYTLVTNKNISVGEELLADYAMWEADESYTSKWTCSCGSDKCRHQITGKDWKLNELQNAYKNHFSPLINKRIITTRGTSK